jgi:hypothetical protein
MSVGVYFVSGSQITEPPTVRVGEVVTEKKMHLRCLMTNVMPAEVQEVL